jgi:hypothetical protein
MHTISVTFITKIVQGDENAQDDAAALQWVNIGGELDKLIESNQLAFDHSKILSDYKKWMRKTAAVSSIDTSITFWSSKKEEEAQESLEVKSTEA